jgi:hypothetical protein
MAGNIHARQRTKHLKSAKTFYDQALAQTPRTSLPSTNIRGGNSMQMGCHQEAERY